jgi:hypothetical protein
MVMTERADSEDAALGASIRKVMAQVSGHYLVVSAVAEVTLRAFFTEPGVSDLAINKLLAEIEVMDEDARGNRLLAEAPVPPICEET